MIITSIHLFIDIHVHVCVCVYIYIYIFNRRYLLHFLAPPLQSYRQHQTFHSIDKAYYNCTLSDSLPHDVSPILQRHGK